jgi:hypothetical protein
MQKDKTVLATVSPVEEIECVEGPPCPLNSAVQSVFSDKSQVTAVDRVGGSQSRLAVEQEHEMQLDAEETESHTQKQTSSVAKVHGRKWVDGGTEAHAVQQSSVSVQEGGTKLNLKDCKVNLKQLSLSLIGQHSQHNQPADLTDAEVSSKQLSDTALSLIEQSDTVPVTKMSSSVVLPVNTDRPSSCDTNSPGAFDNTALNADGGNSLVSTADCMVQGIP